MQFGEDYSIGGNRSVGAVVGDLGGGLAKVGGGLAKGVTKGFGGMASVAASGIDRRAADSELSS